MNECMNEYPPQDSGADSFALHYRVRLDNKHNKLEILTSGTSKSQNAQFVRERTTYEKPCRYKPGLGVKWERRLQDALPNDRP
eukprot:9480677-Pyramimonas_sp.AAC.1